MVAAVRGSRGSIGHQSRIRTEGRATHGPKGRIAHIGCIRPLSSGSGNYLWTQRASRRSKAPVSRVLYAMDDARLSMMCFVGDQSATTQ